MRTALAIILSVAWSATGWAESQTLTISFVPAGDSQVAVWLEDPSGDFVDTVMVTRLVGTFGLGNRPGRSALGHGYLWPYGRRESALPIWAHKRGVMYDRIVFQDCREGALGWHEIDSSSEPFYCRPVTENEMMVDTITCPTVAFRTDKGIPLRVIRRSCPGLQAEPDESPYPPRNDLARYFHGTDWDGIQNYAEQNDLDAVSRATPAAGAAAEFLYALPGGLAAGEYTVNVEVNLEYDSNATHNYDFEVDPQLPDYGIVGRGQPSLLWQIPIELGGGPRTEIALAYSGYGDPSGASGVVSAPDNTITDDIEGSGSGILVPFDGARVKVQYDDDAECAPPTTIEALRTTQTDFNMIEIQVVANMAAGETVEIRYAEGESSIATLEDFMAAIPGDVSEGQVVRLTQGIRPDTPYSVAARIRNGCDQTSALTTVDAKTPEREFTTVDACFIATAAHGGVDQADVATLRRFRDNVLLPHPVGAKFVAAYYAISPPVADVIRDNDALRQMTRIALKPLVVLAESTE